MTYRDAALAAHAAAVQAEKDQAARERDALILAAREAVRPLLTDAVGKVLLDPLKGLTAPHVDESAQLVVLSTTDGSDVHFAVRSGVVRLAWHIDGEWASPDPTVLRDLDDVGAGLAPS